MRQRNTDTGDRQPSEHENELAQQHTSQEKQPKRDKGASRVDRMGNDSIPKLIIEFAIPSVVGMVVNGSYAIINSVFLGQAVGEIGLSAITVAQPTLVVFMAIAMLIGNGGNALAALRLGEGNHDEAERILGNVVTISCVVSVFVALAGLSPDFVNMVLTISSTTEDVRPLAFTYVQILCIGYIFQCIGMGVNNFIRTCGAPVRALVTMVIGLVSSALFNYMFVMVFGWGILGSALATISGQFLSSVAVLWYFLGVAHAPLHIRVKAMKPAFARIRSILMLGFPSFVIQAGMAIINFILNYQLVKYGALTPIGSEHALASIGVIQRIAQFSVFPLIGIAVAIQPLLGFNYGARKYDRVKKTYWYGVGGAVACGIVMWAIIYGFTEPIVYAFGITDAALGEFTVFAMRVQFITLPLVGFQIVSSNYFQATGQPAKSIFLSLTRQIVFLVPLLLILPQALPQVMPFLTGLDTLYFAPPFADTLSILVTAGFVVFEMKRLRNLMEGTITAKH